MTSVGIDCDAVWSHIFRGRDSSSERQNRRGPLGIKQWQWPLPFTTMPIHRWCRTLCTITRPACNRIGQNQNAASQRSAITSFIGERQQHCFAKKLSCRERGERRGKQK